MTGREHSQRSGRVEGTVNVDAMWLRSMLERLRGFVGVAGERDPALVHEAEFSAAWAADWLVAYSQGWVAGDEADGGALGEVLRTVRAAAARLPEHLRLGLLGICADSALQVRVRMQGEHKAKTPPNLVRSVGALVQAELFDEKGRQHRILNDAVVRALSLLRDLELLPEARIPEASTVRNWHKEWLEENPDAPRLRPGRPKKRSV